MTYTEQLFFMKTTKEKDVYIKWEWKGLLVTFGVDADNQLKSSYVKFWDVSVNNF